MRTLQLTLVAGLLMTIAWFPGNAAGAPSVRLSASLRPEHLGTGTTIRFGFTITGDEAPAPLIDVRLSLPTNLGIAASGLGIAGCKVQILEARGPSGCPSNSVMGYGSALVEVPFGPEIVKEMARAVIFAAPIENQQFKMLFFISGKKPVIANLVFPAEILPSALPFGSVLDTRLPLVATLPGAPDVAVVKLAATLGPSGVTYYKHNRRGYIPYRPKGILLPKKCPSGGFRFVAVFDFEDTTQTSSNATVPCPR